MKKTGKEILGASVHTERPDSQNGDVKKVAAEGWGASVHTERPEHPYLKN